MLSPQARPKTAFHIPSDLIKKGPPLVNQPGEMDGGGRHSFLAPNASPNNRARPAEPGFWQAIHPADRSIKAGPPVLCISRKLNSTEYAMLPWNKKLSSSTC
ncbi:hypothetical protein AOLI_G00159140 [Acnodon oligacanthus]